MKIKHILFIILSITSLQTHAIAAYAVGTPVGSSRTSDDVFISRKFNHMVACDLVFSKLKAGNYEYFCPNPPSQDGVLFMSTVFDTSHWPSKIIYYMADK